MSNEFPGYVDRWSMHEYDAQTGVSKVREWDGEDGMLRVRESWPCPSLMDDAVFAAAFRSGLGAQVADDVWRSPPIGDAK